MCCMGSFLERHTGNCEGCPQIVHCQASSAVCRLSAAAAKSLQSCPTLSDPMDCGLPGFSIHGILQARVLEWGAIAFSGRPNTYIYNGAELINKIQVCFKSFLNLHFKKPLGGVSSSNQY